VEARHSQAGFARDRMGPARAADFDAELTTLLQRLATAGRVRTRPADDGDGDGRRLDLRVVAQVGWGRPAGSTRSAGTA
jgi:hypothetical protein